jgi:hypothetical protein
MWCHSIFSFEYNLISQNQIHFFHQLVNGLSLVVHNNVMPKFINGQIQLLSMVFMYVRYMTWAKVLWWWAYTCKRWTKLCQTFKQGNFCCIFGHQIDTRTWYLLHGNPSSHVHKVQRLSVLQYLKDSKFTMKTGWILHPFYQRIGINYRFRNLALS